MIDLYDEFKYIIGAFHGEGIPYALCGGLAMAVHGLPRATVDIDLLVPRDHLQMAIELVGRLGFDIAANPMNLADGAVLIHRRSKTDPDSEDLLSLDLIEVTPPLEELWTMRQKVAWEGGELLVLDRQALIRMKSLRMSGMDRDDIKFLEEADHEG